MTGTKNTSTGGSHGWAEMCVAVVSLVFVTANIVFVSAAAGGAFGPVPPTALLGLAIVAGLVFVGLLTAAIFYRLNVLTTAVSLVLVAGTTAFYVWAAIALAREI